MNRPVGYFCLLVSLQLCDISQGNVSQSRTQISASGVEQTHVTVSPLQKDMDTSFPTRDVDTTLVPIAELGSTVHEISTIHLWQVKTDLVSEAAIQPSYVSSEKTHILQISSSTVNTIANTLSESRLATEKSLAIKQGDEQFQSMSSATMTGITEEQQSLSHSHAISTEPTSVSTPRTETLCEAFVCERSQGMAVNTTYCTLHTGNRQISVFNGLVVEIWAGPSPYSADCEWELVIPKEYIAVIAFDSMELVQGNWTISISNKQKEKTVLLQTVNSSMLRAESMNVSSRLNVHFLYTDEHPRHLPPVIFRVTLLPNVLPSGRLSSTAGFVTSPGLLETWRYIIDYDGSFQIPVPENYSVILKFVYFDMGSDPNATFCYDFVMVYEIDRNNGTETVAWKGCYKPSSMQTYHTSVRVRFVSDIYQFGYRGFMLKYIVLPSTEMPVLGSQNRYDCSVPYFIVFKPLFSCDVVKDCEGNEDEEDCSYSLSPVFLSAISMCGENQVICQMAPKAYVTISTYCNFAPTIEIKSTTELTTVHVAANPWSLQSSQYCQWHILIPAQHFVQVKLFQPIYTDNSTGHESITISNYGRTILDLSISDMRIRRVNITSFTTLTIDYRSSNPAKSPVVTFQFIAFRNILPSNRLTGTAGIVTSPNFGFGQYYPDHYDGTFDIHVPGNFSVLIKVAYMSILSERDFIQIHEINQNNDTGLLALVLTGHNVPVPLKTFHCSVRLRFISHDSGENLGFKIVYAILPTYLEPVQLKNRLYNCSVPHVDLLIPVFRCDFLQECDKNEDEIGCGYSGPCPVGTLVAGTKCYSRSRLNRNFTWYDARSGCESKGQAMISVPTFESWTRLKKLSYDFYIFDVFVGLQLGQWSNLAAPLSAMYKDIWQWSDTWAALTVNITASPFSKKKTIPTCAFGNLHEDTVWYLHCFEYENVDLLCEFELTTVNETNSKTLNNVLVLEDGKFPNVSVTYCPAGYVTRDFLSCDAESQCYANETTSCSNELSRFFPNFKCDSQGQSIPFSLVCDHISHCDDHSDEKFCQFDVCRFGFFRCRNKQCVGMVDVCNQKMNCFDNSDEMCQSRPVFIASSVNPPARVNFSGVGTVNMVQTYTCPLTHFRCLDGYCLPVYMRCNGISDCIAMEDEYECDHYKCQGYYRCRGSTICLHPDHVCDGVFQCPQCDDELICQPVVCPNACRCLGLSFVCTSALPVNFSNPQLRYLDVSGTVFTPQLVSNNRHLITLAVSAVGMTSVPALALPNLRQLDLSDNDITFVDFKSFSPLVNLKILILRGNPLDKITFTSPLTHLNREIVKKNIHPELSEIDMSRSDLEVYNGSQLASCPNLKSLNISYSKLHRITKEGFRSTPMIKQLDIGGNDLNEFPVDVLKSLSNLRSVHTDNFALCCQALLPEGFDVSQCHTKKNLLASCEDLLRNNTYRVFLWIMAALALLGNFGSFVGRFYLSKEERKLGSFSVFVTNLSIADFCMGVYLSIVGVADNVYRGDYLRHSEQWKNSAICRLAGFLSQLSNEVSALIICLITLDRFLVICFPFSHYVHFQKRSALGACAITWLVGIALASVPLLPATSHWQYYSQTGICIPLPFSTSDDFTGYSYSLGVMIILNFVLFLLIAIGQLIIYWSIRKNTMASSKSSVAKQATVARRLTTIVLSDFLCWFPIGLLGLLAATGTPISGEVNVAVAILVLPFNSALNPFLYTLNTLMEKRQKSLENKLLKRLERSLQKDRGTAVSSAAASSGKETDIDKIS